MTERKEFEGICKLCEEPSQKCVQCTTCQLVVCPECCDLSDECDMCLDGMECPQCRVTVLSTELGTCQNCGKTACVFCLTDDIYGYGKCQSCLSMEEIEFIQTYGMFD